MEKEREEGKEVLEQRLNSLSVQVYFTKEIFSQMIQSFPENKTMTKINPLCCAVFLMLSVFL